MLLAVFGAFSIPLCYLFFALNDTSGYQIFVLSLVTVIGTLTGFEIPLLTRILDNKEAFEDNISDILTFDYLGALGATLLFPFFLLPFLGLYRSSLLFGFINLMIAIVTLRIFRKEFENHSYKKLSFFAGLIIASVILFMFINVDRHMDTWRKSLYKYPIIHSEVSPYQKIDIAKNNSEFRLYLNGAIQFSSRDEYRYHEALVHIPLSQLDSVYDVLILGGGEGLAVREVLKYKELQSITLVDIDPAITKLSKENPLLKRLNENAFNDPRVHVLHEDAMVFLKNNEKTFDAIILDLPDPSNESLARLYSEGFFKLCNAHLKQNGTLATQATSPHLSKNAFWCINETLRSSGFSYTYPYHVHIPAFGNWGFIMAKRNPDFNKHFRKDIELKSLEDASFDQLFYFPKDIRVFDVEINQLDRPILLEYYLEHWQSLQGEKR